MVASSVAILGSGYPAARPSAVPSLTIGAASSAPVRLSSVHPDVAYAVTFNEVGLPANLTWMIGVGRTTESYFTDGGTDTLIFTEPSGSYSYNITNIPGWQQSNLSYSGTIVVSGAPVTEPTITYSPVTYSVVFAEMGLPSGLTWQVTVGGAPQSLLTDGGTDSLTFHEANGTYSYAIADNPGWNQVTLPYSGSLHVAGAAITEPTLTYTEVTYSVIFQESGLAAGNTWQVTVNSVLESLTTNGGTDSLTWTGLPNGTYSYSVTGIAGWTQTTLPYSGSVVVNGASVSEPTLVYSRVTYAVVFNESGLPSGIVWQVTVGREVQSVLTDGGTDALTFDQPNGSYAYSISGVAGWEQSSIPNSGSVLVAGAAVLEPTAVYTQVTYSVTFTESGLPASTNWSVTLGSSSENSTGTSIVFTEPNGTYSFHLGIVPGFTPSPVSGSKVVNGADVSVSVVFTQVTYAVTFTESNLPASTSWAVTIDATTHSSTSTHVVFNEPNGTYTYTIPIVSGYVPGAESGTITVNGAATGASVVFTQVLYTVTFTESGLPARGISSHWAVAFGGTLESTNSTSIHFPADNGSHTYLVRGPAGFEVSATLAPEGTITVNGGSVSQPVTFLRGATPSIVFHEVGLAASTSWCVTIGSSVCSTTSTVAFRNLTPGAYGYAVGAFTGMTTVVHLGLVSVGASGSTSIGPAKLFQVRFTFPVTFSETGLPASTTWKVSSGGQLASSSGTTNVIDLINGTYSFLVVHVRGYVATPASGRFMIAGGPLTIAIHFAVAAAEPAQAPVSGFVALWMAKAVAALRLV